MKNTKYISFDDIWNILSDVEYNNGDPSLALVSMCELLMRTGASIFVNNNELVALVDFDYSDYKYSTSVIGGEDEKYRTETMKQQVDAYKHERKSLCKKDKEGKKPNHSKRKVSTKLFLKDLEKIIVYKNKQGIKKGYREYLIYLAQERMLWSGYSEEKTLKKSHQLNQMFLDPLFDSEVERRCKPSQIWWNCTSIEKVISGLEIDTKLQQQLCYLQERRIKDLKKKRIRNKHPLLNRSKKEVDMLIRRTHVCKLKKEGKSNTEIANILTESKSTITLDLKYIQKNKHEFRKVLAETIESIVAILSDNKKIRSIIYDEQKRLREWLESGVISLNDSG